MEGFSSERKLERKTDESSQEDCLPFFLDDDSSGPEGSPSHLRQISMKSTYGFSLDTKTDRYEAPSTTSRKVDHTVKYGSGRRKENFDLRSDSQKSSYGSLSNPPRLVPEKPGNAPYKGANKFILFSRLVFSLDFEKYQISSQLQLFTQLSRLIKITYLSPDLLLICHLPQLLLPSRAIICTRQKALLKCVQRQLQHPHCRSLVDQVVILTAWKVQKVRALVQGLPKGQLMSVRFWNSHQRTA